ncbi:MAG: VWA domain-containing protein [Bdellovibrionales bacterium]|nr:VWA domain-containing protein [Bdellovibrionales bacterium]
MTSYQQSDRYPYSYTKSEFMQDMYDKNELTARFKAYDAQGRTIPRLEASDFSVYENNMSVTDFELASSSSDTGKSLDIVFTIDTTGTMKQEINSVKDNIRNLVDGLERQNIRSNLCLVTFKDEIYDKCRNFVIDDPVTPENENLVHFLEQVTKLKAEGGGDPRENALGGALEALKNTPWHSNSQRMVILFTDAYFWFLPHHKNEREAQWAPYYDDVLEAIENAGAQVFVIGPKAGGFDKDWFGHPSLPDHSGGQWFNIEKLRKGEVTLASIFDYIIEQVKTVYNLKYFAENNGLDPTLPLSQRQISIQSTGLHNIARIEVVDFQSNMPNGRPNLKTRFPLQDTSPINASTLEVNVNSLPSSDFVLDGYDLLFNSAPDQGAKIVATYEMGDLIDNVRLQPFVLKGNGELADIRVWVNNRVLNTNEYAVTLSLDGKYHLDLKDPVFMNSDPFGIRNAGELYLYVEYTRVVRP